MAMTQYERKHDYREEPEIQRIQLKTNRMQSFRIKRLHTEDANRMKNRQMQLFNPH